MAEYTRLNQIKDKIYGTNFQGQYNRAKTVGRLLLQTWTSEAAKVLNSTYGPYVKSLGLTVSDDLVVCELPKNATGKQSMIARMQEFGFGPGGIGTQGEYDMRVAGQKLLSSKKVKQGKNGPYLVIPFSFNTAEASVAADTANKSRGAATLFQNLAAKDGKKVFSTSSQEKGRTLWGTRLPTSMGFKLKEHHANTQAAGMVRMGAVSGASGKMQTSSYKTFRTASMANTHPMAWRTKGIEAKNIGQTVMEAIPDILAQAGLV
tara:strand:+ start:1999 stop:2784 length:786 start_codon:yes stop_codon:yes gene_type:complete